MRKIDTYFTLSHKDKKLFSPVHFKAFEVRPEIEGTTGLFQLHLHFYMKNGGHLLFDLRYQPVYNTPPCLVLEGPQCGEERFLYTMSLYGSIKQDNQYTDDDVGLIVLTAWEERDQ